MEWWTSWWILCFIEIDLRSDYHWIWVKEKDIPKTAFKTRYTHHDYSIMPFHRWYERHIHTTTSQLYTRYTHNDYSIVHTLYTPHGLYEQHISSLLGHIHCCFDRCYLDILKESSSTLRQFVDNLIVGTNCIQKQWPLTILNIINNIRRMLIKNKYKKTYFNCKI